MGMFSNYMMVDEATLGAMSLLDNAALLEMIEALEEKKRVPVYGMDKLWDGLHFLLTGVSASSPIEENPLSEAIVGVHVFNEDDDEADFVGCIENEELAEIMQAMLDVDTDKLETTFDLRVFRENEIYPNIWLDENRENLFNELVQAFNNLLAFYHKAATEGKHIVISIY